MSRKSSLWITFGAGAAVLALLAGASVLKSAQTGSMPEPSPIVPEAAEAAPSPVPVIAQVTSGGELVVGDSAESDPQNEAIFAAVAAAVEKPPITIAGGAVLVPASGFDRELVRLSRKLVLDGTFRRWIACSSCGANDLDPVNREIDDGTDSITSGAPEDEGRPIIAGSKGLRIVYGVSPASVTLPMPTIPDYYQPGGKHDDEAADFASRLVSVPASVVLRLLEEVAATAAKNHCSMWFDVEGGYVRITEHGLVSFQSSDQAPNDFPRQSDGATTATFAANTVYVLNDVSAPQPEATSVPEIPN